MICASCSSSAAAESWGRGCVGQLPREPRRPILVRVDDWWAQALLPMRVVLVADNNSSLTALGLPRTISCTACERLPLHLFLWYKSQGTEHLFPHPVFSLSYQQQHSPYSFHPYLFRLSDLGEMAHDDDRGKRPCDMSSNRGSGSPPPHRMRSVASAHSMHALRR
jgi:hypothetical protein